MLYRITNGAVSYGANTVLEEINFEIREGERIAIVGRNGCGKSTLLNLITGALTPSEGTGKQKLNVALPNNGSAIGYLKQIAFADNTLTLLEEVLKVYSPITQLEAQMKSTATLLESDHSDKIIKSYSDMRDKYEFLGGYTYKREYETAIKNFGFTEEDKAKPLSAFSGGQRTKIALVKLLLSKPDLLLLDEPTNHLDMSAIEWLEDYLRNYKKSMVIVSHDRMFIDKIVNVVYEIEYGTTTRYSGNYSAYTEQKQANYIKQAQDYEAQKKEIERLNEIVDRFRYKPTKASMAQSKLKQIERMVIIDDPAKADMRTFHAAFQPQEENVKKVLEVKNLSIGYDKALSTLNFQLMRGQKLGIIGANGIGKSTFLKTLVSKLPPLGGTFQFGARTEIGYFDQQMAQYSCDKTVFDDFFDEFPTLNETEVRSALGAFLFTGEDVFKRINMLSGGEKVRLALCKILRRKPNVLIMDEPTNHMDIVGKETLETLLKEYSGTLIFVSHDRYFIQKIADSLLVFDNVPPQPETLANSIAPCAKVMYYPCGYNKYIEEKEKSKVVATPSATAKDVKKPQAKSFTTPLKEKDKRERRIKKLEAMISDCDNRIAELSEELQKPEVFSDYVKVTEIQNQISAENSAANDYMEEWDSLSSLE